MKMYQEKKTSEKEKTVFVSKSSEADRMRIAELESRIRHLKSSVDIIRKENRLLRSNKIKPSYIELSFI